MRRSVYILTQYEWFTATHLGVLKHAQVSVHVQSPLLVVGFLVELGCLVELGLVAVHICQEHHVVCLPALLTLLNITQHRKGVYQSANIA